MLRRVGIVSPLPSAGTGFSSVASAVACVVVAESDGELSSRLETGVPSSPR